MARYPGIEDLYEQESVRVLAMCRAILGGRGDPEDAMQETFARLAARIDSLHGDPAGYLVVIARNVCRDELRRRRRALAARCVLPPERAPDDAAVDRGVLRFAWHHLSRAERALVTGVADGFSVGEVAWRLGVSVDVAAQRLSRARRRIRRLVAAPALLLGPIVASAERSLQWLARVPAGIAGAAAARGHQSDALGVLALALIAGMVAAPPTGTPFAPRVTSHPPAQAPAVGVPLPDLSAEAHRQTALHGHPVSFAVAAASGSHALPAAPTVPSPSIFDNTRVNSFAASPDYTNDHTVFAIGTCTAPGCSRLFRSNDGGHSWLSLGGAGLVDGSRILLPPDYPRNAVIFAAAIGSGLLRSADGGATFVQVTPPINDVAAMDPSSPPGDPHVDVQIQPGVALAVYRDSDRSLTPVTGLPPDVEAITALFSAPRAGAVYVAISEVVGGGSLYACTGAATCTRTGPGLTGMPVLSPTFDVDHTLFTVQTNAVSIGRIDGGGARTVSTGLASAIAAVPAADYATSGRLDLVVHSMVNMGEPLAMLRYVLGAPGATSVPAAFTGAMDLTTVQRLPDGHILVALALDAGRNGVVCSSDDAASFAAIC